MYGRLDARSTSHRRAAIELQCSCVIDQEECCGPLWNVRQTTHRRGTGSLRPAVSSALGNREPPCRGAAISRTARRASAPPPAPSIRTGMAIFYVVAWAPYLATLGRAILLVGRHVAVALLRRMA